MEQMAAIRFKNTKNEIAIHQSAYTFALEQKKTVNRWQNRSGKKQIGASKVYINNNITEWMS